VGHEKGSGREGEATTVGTTGTEAADSPPLLVSPPRPPPFYLQPHRTTTATSLRWSATRWSQTSARRTRQASWGSG